MTASYNYLQQFYKDLKKCKSGRDYKSLQKKILDPKRIESFEEIEQKEIIEEVESVINYLA